MLWLGGIESVFADYDLGYFHNSVPKPPVQHWLKLRTKNSKFTIQIRKINTACIQEETTMRHFSLVSACM